VSELVPKSDELFTRVAAILDEARGNVVRAVNSNMVIAYWHIGREIVLGVQDGDQRAEYGKQVLSQLSSRLQVRYGKGFSVQSLENFRMFYLVNRDREPKSSPSGRISAFAPELTWSHYRALMRVTDSKAREFYEQEAIESGWSRDQLERQIHSAYYQRILANHGEPGLVAATRERLPGEPVSAREVLRSPVVLEFLDLPDTSTLHESHLEQAIIDNLQAFLLELGKGFAFVARQKHLRFEDEDYYVDLVLYNFVLKCFVLIDLKIGKLSHADVGQMDGYVRLFEDRFKIPGDNPTVGLILCSEKNEAVAKYSVLSESKQLFASKYLAYFPSEEELALELKKERRLIEARRESTHD
jgi:predicted nuclease of restriction endonuclease-like (RecB) superfamily